MTMPYVLSNGPGNFPDADKLMANYDYLENGVTGRTTFRNRIINGDMRIDQRNAGGAITQTTGNTYTVDRWSISGSVTSKLSAQRNYGVTSPTGFSNHLGILSLSSYSVGVGEAFTVTHAIEGYNVTDLAWGTASAKTVTLSFWFRSNMSGGTVFGGALQNSATDRSYPFSFSSVASNTWEYKTITIPGDQSGTWLTNDGIGIQLRLSLGVGTTLSGTAGAWAAGNYRSATGAASVVGTNAATLFITGVQLEAGASATPYEFLPMSQEMSLCERYFQKSFPITTPVAQSTGVYYGAVSYVVQTGGAGPIPSERVYFSTRMRASPTLIFYSPISLTNKWFNRTGGTESGNGLTPYSEQSQNCFTVFNTQVVTDAVNHSIYIHWSADAEI
jgi:hypothetical protein